jgi:hypothetical protein
MTLHFMSDKELSRLEILRDLGSGRLTETAVLENKRLGGLLTLIRQSQQGEPPGQRTRKGPKRRDQTGHMFNVG